MNVVDTATGLLIGWFAWEVMSLFQSQLYNSESGEYVVPPASLSQYYMRKRWTPDK